MSASAEIDTIPGMSLVDSPPVKLNFSTKWQYAPAPESVKVEIKPRYDLFINGQFVAPADGKYFATTTPANEKKLSEVASAG